MHMIALLIGLMLAPTAFANGLCETTMNGDSEDSSSSELKWFNQKLRILGQKVLPAPAPDKLAFTKHAATVSSDLRAEAEAIKNELMAIFDDPRLIISADMILFWAINTAYPELAMTALPKPIKSVAIPAVSENELKRFTLFKAFRPPLKITNPNEQTFIESVAKHYLETNAWGKGNLSISPSSLFYIYVKTSDPLSQKTRYISGANLLFQLDRFRLRFETGKFNKVTQGLSGDFVNLKTDPEKLQRIRKNYEVLAMEFGLALYATNATMAYDDTLPNYFEIKVSGRSSDKVGALEIVEPIESTAPGSIYIDLYILNKLRDLNKRDAIPADALIFYKDFQSPQIKGPINRESFEIWQNKIQIVLPDHIKYEKIYPYLLDLIPRYSDRITSILQRAPEETDKTADAGLDLAPEFALGLKVQENVDLFRYLKHPNDHANHARSLLSTLVNPKYESDYIVKDLDAYIAEKLTPNQLPTIKFLQDFIDEQIPPTYAQHPFLVRHGWVLYDGQDFVQIVSTKKINFGFVPSRDLTALNFTDSSSNAFLAPRILATWMRPLGSVISLTKSDSLVFQKQHVTIKNGNAVYLPLDLSDPQTTLVEVENALKSIADAEGGSTFINNYFKKIQSFPQAQFHTKTAKLNGTQFLEIYHKLRIKEGVITADKGDYTSFNYIRTHITGFLDSSNVAQLIYDNKLQELFMLYVNDPAGLDEIMRAFLPPHSAYIKQPQSITGLIKMARRNIEAGTEGAIDESPQHALEVVLKRFGSHPDAFDRTSDNHIAHILLRIFRKDFAANQQLTLKTIQDMMSVLTQHGDYKLKQEQTDRINRLLEAVFNRLQNAHNIAVSELMVLPPFASQREAIAFLMERSAAILADDVGLGKSYPPIASYMTLREQKVITGKMLWVTTKSNLPEFASNVKDFTGRDDVIAITGGTDETLDQLIDRAIKSPDLFISINYEMLVRVEAHPRYEEFVAIFDVMAVDEGQKIDNEESDRSKAVRRINIKYRWLISATPYQSDYRRLFTILNWLDPERFPNQESFNAEFPRTDKGIEALREAMEEYMLGRSLLEVATEAKDFSEVPLAVQLAQGKALVPQRKVLPTRSYELSKEQQDMLVEIAVDFPGWARRYNAWQSDPSKHIKLDSLNSGSQLVWQQTVITRPMSVGLKMPDSFWQIMDEEVAQLIAEGKKGVIWVDSIEFREALVERYASKGALSLSDSHDHIDLFNTKAEHPVLIGNMRSGGLGLNIKGADVTFMLEWPMSIAYPGIHQTLGRTRRIMTALDLAYAKAHSNVKNIVPTFTPGFIDSLRESKARAKKVYRNGTPAEHLLGRHAENEILFMLFKIGAISEEDMKRSMYAQLFSALEED